MMPGIAPITPEQAAALRLEHSGIVDITTHLKVLLEFLSRTDLKGREVPAYVEASNILQAIGSGELIVMQPKKLTEAQEWQPKFQEAQALIDELDRRAGSSPKLKATLDGARIVLKEGSSPKGPKAPPPDSTSNGGAGDSPPAD